MATTPREEVLLAAGALITGERRADYGPPEVNFKRIADIWNVILAKKLDTEKAVTPADVALMMAGLKIARAAEGYKPDTAIDLAGYAALYGELSEVEQ